LAGSSELAAHAVPRSNGIGGLTSSYIAMIAERLETLQLESQLSDPAFDPRAAAEAAGISVRYANSLLSQQSTSLERLIVSRRFEHCRRALEDPGQSQRTITDIAVGWGFGPLALQPAVQSGARMLPAGLSPPLSILRLASPGISISGIDCAELLPDFAVSRQGPADP